jgi:hypothetical protein
MPGFEIGKQSEIAQRLPLVIDRITGQ